MSGKEPVKVVVRLLPPEITEAELLATVDEKHKQNAKWHSFVAGKRYKGEAKPCLNSRCYFQFESLGQCEDFTKDYHGHQFVDGQGESFRAVVCIAPYQKVPRAKQQKDPRDGTIEDDPIYKEFLEGLANKATTYDAPPNPKMELRPATPGDTPLLQFMKTRATERRARAEKRRKEREKWRPEGGYIEEDPSWKKSRWRCKECGATKNLEEDPDERGIFYCTPCWEYWETEEASSKPKKKKKKKHKKDEEEWYEEEEEEEEETASKKKKKKSKKHGKDEEDWWEQQPAEEEWADEGEAGAKKKKKKKKKQEEEETWYEEETKKSKWKAKSAQSESWQEEAPSKSSRSKKKKDDEWWEETPTEEKASKSSGRRRKKHGEDGGGGGSGSRWVAKS